MIETLAERVNADALLVHRGRYINTRFLLEIGERRWIVRIVDGRVADVIEGPFTMPNYAFALRASAMDWAEFWSPKPRAGYHDLIALVRFKRLKTEGDMHPFMANLFYFKGVLAKLRGVSA